MREKQLCYNNARCAERLFHDRNRKGIILTDYITNVIENYGLIAIFIVIALEYACFPVPSELVLPLSGAVAAQGKFNFWAVYLLSIAAGLVGSWLCYGIGRYGGVPILQKIERKFPKFGGGIQIAKGKFEKYSTLSVGICRVVPLCRTYISFVAGLAQQNLLTFTLASGLGISIWNAILVGLGYLLSANWRLVMVYYDKYKFLMLGAFVLAVVAYILLKRYFGKKEAQALAEVQEKNEKWVE